ncbi:MAG: MarR family transcriptional regulator [Clostridia bacterium]|nr:MarR family transcriptional regulator [Clostridia bacterium]
MYKNPWLLRLIKQINTKARNDLNNNLRRYDVTDAQLEVLMYLIKHKEECINQRQIEGALSLSNPTVVSLLDRLEEKKLIMRLPGASDRRQKQVTITESGKSLCDALYDDFCKKEQSLLESLDKEDQKTLKRLLDSLLENILESKGDIQ